MPTLIITLFFTISALYLRKFYPTMLDDPLWSKDIRTWAAFFILVSGIVIAFVQPYCLKIIICQ